jgi:hypothetical protein
VPHQTAAERARVARRIRGFVTAFLPSAWLSRGIALAVADDPALLPGLSAELGGAGLTVPQVAPSVDAVGAELSTALDTGLAALPGAWPRPGIGWEPRPPRTGVGDALRKTLLAAARAVLESDVVGDHVGVKKRVLLAFYLGVLDRHCTWPELKARVRRQVP